MLDWDDLRIFIAAARAGSLAAAGRKVGVDTATVGRRVARLETSLKCTLLVRSPKGLRLTAAGADLLEIGLDAETAVSAAQRIGHPDVAAGAVRIGAPEWLGSGLLAPALPAFSRSRSNLRIELAANTGFLSPSRREVDIAITLSSPNSRRLLSQALTTYQLALYASPAYLDEAGHPEQLDDLRKMKIVGYIDDLIYAPELRYLDEILGNAQKSLSSSSIQAQSAIIAAGGGVGILPCFLAEGLTRVLPQDVLLERKFWLSMPREIEGTARIKLVIRWLGDLVSAERARLCPY
ncbi:MAG TPA: LysR family transcriptional regulator [Novosphingobium sp.]|nr:LysR family transcriptional regulator [Novosphingobium sp.]